MQTDKELEALPEKPRSRALPRDKQVRAEMRAQTNRDPTLEELVADKAYWDENKDLFEPPDHPSP